MVAKHNNGMQRTTMDMTNMDPKRAINLLIDAVTASPSLDDEELSNCLVGQGLPKAVGKRVIAFVPMAFAHCIFDEPFYVEPRAFVARNGRHDPVVAAIARRSAEAAVLEELAPAA